MAKSKLLMRGIVCLTAGCIYTTQSFAGGMERGGYNIDLLFDQSRFTAESAATFVAPQRKLKNVVDKDITNNVPGVPGGGGGDLNGSRFSTSTTESENYWVPRIGLKVGVTDDIDCLADYSQPWGAHTNPGGNWRGANHNIETKVNSDNYGLTCSYKFAVGEKGQLRFIGGVFYQELDGFKERLVQAFPAGFPLTGVGRLDLKADGWGWRTGIAYEIPEYALRASLVYNSAVDLGDITGTVDLRQVGAGVIPVVGTAKMPDSLELKVQSGVAPDWLVFGSVKWTDWSQLQSIGFFNSGVRVTSLDLIYRDGWTISGGVGHKFNEQWSGALSLAWDRGTSQGFGSQTDTWTLGAAVSYAMTENVELRLAGALGLLTSGKSGAVNYNGVTYGNDVSYAFGNDVVAAVSTSLKVKF
jgi:long-chain fatty acid transport protein